MMHGVILPMMCGVLVESCAFCRQGVGVRLSMPTDSVDFSKGGSNG